MYAITSNPFVKRTFATFRSAEFGFFGVVVYTRVQTPRRNGFALSAGDFSFLDTSRRLRRTSWLIVGIRSQREEQRALCCGAIEPCKLSGREVPVKLRLTVTMRRRLRRCAE